MFTIGNWILFGGLLIGAGALTIYVANEEDGKTAAIVALVCILVIGCVIGGVAFYNTQTASGQRALKDFHSNMDNGIDRNIRIIANDGYVIYEHTGHFDIELHDNYIVFDEDGQRTIIYHDVTSSIIVEELNN